MKTLYQHPKSMFTQANRFCPGCSHATVTKLIGEVIDELNIESKIVNVLAIGCAGLHGECLNVDVFPALHGRAPATATGIKRVRPETIVYAYQGDGDLASIGLCETMHTANRGERFTTIFINNAIYGMTGGQMAPTTLIGQKSTTSPYGRDVNTVGAPLKMCELISQLDAPKYVARFAVNNVPNILKAKAGIKKAFEIQMYQNGYAFVEILSACPTGWGLSPSAALDFVEQKMMPVFPLGVFKEPKGEEK